MNYRKVRESFKSRATQETVFIGDVFGTTDMPRADEKELSMDRYEILEEALLYYFNYSNRHNVFLEELDSDRWRNPDHLQKKLPSTYQLRSRGLLQLNVEEITQITAETISLLEIDGMYYVFGNGNHRTFALLKHYINNADGKTDEETKKKYSYEANVTHLLVNETYSDYLLRFKLNCNCRIEEILDYKRI